MPLAKGGMGAIYRARQQSNGREVAFKVMLSDASEDGSLIQRFKREAEVLSSLKHANIIDVYDYGESDGVLYMVMPLLTHGTLGDKMRQGQMSTGDIRRIMSQITGAVQYANSQHIVHRDLKPENILLDAAGNCKVCDFGIVSIQDASTRLSRVGTLMGSAHYMAPEQCNGGAVDGRTDVYALGIILFQLATGQQPFTGDSWNAVALQQITKPPPKPRALNASLSPNLEAAILTALEKLPENRFASAAAFGAAVEEALSTEGKPNPIGAKKPAAPALPTLVYQPDKQAPNIGRRVVIVGAGALGLAGIGLVINQQLRVPSGTADIRPAGSTIPATQISAEVTRQSTTVATPTAGAPPTNPPRPDPTNTPASAVAVAPIAPVRKAGSDRAIVTLPGAGAGLEIELIRIPAGEFTMGGVEKDDEKPIQKVQLAEFVIGRTEVTVAQFAAFVKATSYKTQAERDGSSYSYDGTTYREIAGANWASPVGPGSTVVGKQTHPVTHVSWGDCMTFCEWAQRVTGVAFTLPNEAQWEKAARGTDGRIYPWGAAPPDDTHANMLLAENDTTPVGKYGIGGSSPYGLDDMAGNVAEWTLSKYEPYPYDPADGRDDPARDASHRVFRGGSWFDADFDMRCANRSDSEPANRQGNIGFRVCVDAVLASL